MSVVFLLPLRRKSRTVRHDAPGEEITLATRETIPLDPRSGRETNPVYQTFPTVSVDRDV
jgi:hypothetical protein